MLPNTEQIQEHMTKKAFEYVNSEFPSFNKSQKENIVKIFCHGYIKGLAYGADEWGKYGKEQLKKAYKVL